MIRSFDELYFEASNSRTESQSEREESVLIDLNNHQLLKLP